MKLNLCSGRKRFKGFTNVDFAPPADVIHDLTKPLPFPDGEAEEIVCIHGFEHFYRYEADAILADWVRVLAPGGLLCLELPCLDKVLGIFNAAIDGGHELPEHLTMWGLYGDPNHENPAMVHKWCYSKAEMMDMMKLHGLIATEGEPQFHQPIRDMRIQGRKLA
jgi:predicted SAM-dependent methyltransferase